MRKLLLFLLLFSFASAFSQGPQTTISVPINSGGTSNINALLYLPTSYAGSSTKYPIIVFLHGAGESGTNLSLIYNNSTAGGPAYFIAQGSWPSSFTNPRTGLQEEFIVVSPQRPGGWSTSAAELKWVINSMVSNYRVDTNKIYITGLSAGGEGTVYYGASYGVTPTYKAAAIVPMSAAISNPSIAPQNTLAGLTVADSVRVWGLGDDPGDVFGVYNKIYVDQMNAIKAGWAVLTDYSGGHCCWNTYYNPTYRQTVNGQSMSIYEWMLQYFRGASVPGNTPPTVNAGSNQDITLPSNSVTLTGTATDDGSIASTVWSTVSGPGGNTITNPTLLTTTITGLSTGTYVFRLTATDNLGAVSTDDVSVTVYSGFSGTINVNIFGGTNPYSNSQWNDWNVGTATTNITSGTFNYSDGSTSSVYATLSHQNAVSDNGTGYNTTTPPPQVGRYASYNWVVGNDRTLTIKGLNPSSTYNISLYSSRNNSGEATDFVIGGSTIRIASSQNLSNAASFSSITPNGSGEIVVQVRWVTNWSYINGFTIVDNNTTPPPSNIPPVVDAGLAQSVNIGTASSTSTTVTGTATDSDGTISSVSWATISQPAGTTGSKFAVTTPGGARHTLMPDAGGYITKTSWAGYNPGDTIFIGASAKAVALENLKGSPTNYYVIRNAPGVKVILGDSLWAGGSYAEAFVIRNSKYLHIYGSSLDSLQVVGSNSNADGGGAPYRNAYTNVAFSKNTGCITFHDIRIRHGGVGILAKTDVVNSDASTWFPHSRMDSLDIYNVNIFNTYNEAMYIGHTATYWNIVTNQPYYPAPGVVVTDTTTYKRPIKWFNVAIHDNILDSIGNDAIQMAAMDTLEVYNNKVTNWAWKNVGGANSSHNGGLLIGGRVTGWYAHDNSLNRAHGEPMQVYAEGNGRIYNNVMWRTFYGDGISMRGLDIIVDIRGNTFWALNGATIRINGAYGQTRPVTIGKNILITPSASYLYTENGGTYTEGTAPNDNKKYNTYAASGVDSANNFAINPAHPSYGYGYLYTPGSQDFSDPIIASPTSLSTGISNLKFGTYIFRFTATDNLGATASDDVQVTVNSGTNNAPTANAGADQLLTETNYNTTVNGSGTDTDGTIVSYLWTKVSGGTATIVSPSSASTAINNMAIGNFVFRLTVTDDDGAAASDDINIAVNGPVITPPITYRYPSNGAADIVINNQTFGVALKAGDSVIIPPRFSGGWRSMTYQGIRSGYPGSYVVVYWEPGAYINTGSTSQIMANYLDSCHGLKVVGVDMNIQPDLFWRLRTGYSSWIWIDSASVRRSLGINMGYSSTFRPFNGDTTNMFHHWKLSNSVIDSLYAMGSPYGGVGFSTGKITTDGFWRDVEIYNNTFSHFKNDSSATRFINLDNCWGCSVYNNSFSYLGMTEANFGHTAVIEFSAGMVDVYNNNFGPEIFGNDVRGKWSKLTGFPAYSRRGRVYNNITFWKRKYSHVEDQNISAGTISTIGTWVSTATTPEIWNITAYKLSIGNTLNSTYNTGIMDSYKNGADTVSVKNSVIISIRDTTWGVNKMAIVTAANGPINTYDTASNRMIEFFADAGITDTITWTPVQGGAVYNQGVPTPTWLTTDRYGNIRNSEGAVDIGAVEHVPAPIIQSRKKRLKREN